MIRTTSLLAAVAALTTFATAPAGAQLNQDHGQYSRADIEAGQRLYGPQCQVCHGGTGDGVPGIDLRLGKFRRVTSDEDIARIVTSGIPGVGMPPFKFQAAELTSIVAFIRAGFDPGSAAVRVGNLDRGRALFAGKAECATCHRVNGRGPRLAPDLSDIGAIRTLAALQRAVLEPNESLLPIHRPVRARDEERRDDSRPAPERRHVHGAADRRQGTAAVARESGPEAILRRDRGRDALVEGQALRRRARGPDRVPHVAEGAVT